MTYVYTRKKPAVRAVKLKENCIIDTLNGKETGRVGDYLVFGLRDDPYIMDSITFELLFLKTNAFIKGKP